MRFVRRAHCTWFPNGPQLSGHYERADQLSEAATQLSVESVTGRRRRTCTPGAGGLQKGLVSAVVPRTHEREGRD